MHCAARLTAAAVTHVALSPVGQRSGAPRHPRGIDDIENLQGITGRLAGSDLTVIGFFLRLTCDDWPRS